MRLAPRLGNGGASCQVSRLRTLFDLTKAHPVVIASRHHGGTFQ
jgi:hypothetical protein